MVRRLKCKPGKCGPNARATRLNLHYEKEAFLLPYLHRLPAVSQLQTYRVPARIWQVNANGEACLALPCQFGSDSARTRGSRPFPEVSPHPYLHLHPTSEESTSHPAASATALPRTSNKCLPRAPRAIVKGLTVQSGSAPYLIST